MTKSLIPPVEIVIDERLQPGEWYLMPSDIQAQHLILLTKKAEIDQALEALAQMLKALEQMGARDNDH